jgi:hypothetical protein
MAIISYKIIKYYLLAILVSGICSSIILQVFDFIYLGYLEPFFILAFIFGGIYSMGIALVVGIPFYYYRKKKSQRFHDPETAQSKF